MPLLRKTSVVPQQPLLRAPHCQGYPFRGANCPLAADVVSSGSGETRLCLAFIICAVPTEVLQESSQPKAILEAIHAN